MVTLPTESPSVIAIDLSAPELVQRGPCGRLDYKRLGCELIAKTLPVALGRDSGLELREAERA